MASSRMTGQPVYVLTMKRSPTDPRWVLGELRKRWFDVAELQSTSRTYAEAWVDCSGMTEAETLASVLQDLRSAVLDSMG